MIEFFIDKDREGFDLAKQPTRNQGDAGIDVYIPRNTKQFRDKIKEVSVNCNGWYLNDYGVVISPNCDVLIPTMLYSKFDQQVALKVMNKSGIATKRKLTKVAELIDSSYQGMIMIHIYNLSTTKEMSLAFDEKFTQLVPIIIDSDPIMVSNCDSKEDFFNGVVTERGDGGFGHGGLK